MTSALLERMGWVLVHSLWQFALVAGLAVFFLPLLGRAKATARYNFLVVLLGLAACLPVATWAWLGTPDGSMRELAPVGLATSLPPISEPAQPWAGGAAVALVLKSNTGDMGEPAFSALGALEDLEWWIRPWLGTLVVCWLLGLAAFSLRPLWGWVTLRRLARHGLLAAPEGLVRQTGLQAARLGIWWPVRLHLSAQVSCPLVVGYLRPLILLPVGLVSGVPCSQLEALVLHELAHIRRHDFVVNLAQVVLETVFFYHPAIWWLSGRIRAEREHCCDDVVLAWGGDAGDYGRALLAVEEARGAEALLALGAGGGTLRTRVLRLFGNPGAGVKIPGNALLVLGAFLAGLSWLGFHLSAGGAAPDPEKLPDMTIEEIAKKVEEGAGKIRTGHMKFEVLEENLASKKVETGQSDKQIRGPSKVVFEYWLDGENFRRDRTILQWEFPKNFPRSGESPVGKRYIQCVNFLKKGQVLRDFDVENKALFATILTAEQARSGPENELEDPRLIGLNSGRMAFLSRFRLKDLFDGNSRKNGQVDKIVYQGEPAYRLTWDKEFQELEKPGRFTCVVIPAKNFGIVEFTGKTEHGEFTKKLKLKQVSPGIWFPEKTTFKQALAWGDVYQETVTTLVASINQKIEPAVFRPEGMGYPDGKLFGNNGADTTENQSLIFYKGHLLPVIFNQNRLAPLSEYDKKYPNLEKKGGAKEMDKGVLSARDALTSLKAQTEKSRLDIRQLKLALHGTLQERVDGRTGTSEYDCNYWLDGEKSRWDFTWAEGIKIDGKLVPGFRQITAYDLEKAGSLFNGSSDRSILNKFLEKSESGQKVDCRNLGLFNGSFGILWVFKNANFLVASPDTEPASRQVEYKGKNAIEVSWINPYGVSSRVVFLPEMDNGIVLMEDRDGETVHTVESELAFFPKAKKYFPTKVTHTQKTNGVWSMVETLQVKVESINEPIPGEAFTFSGLGLPNGALIYSYPEKGEGKLVKVIVDGKATDPKP